MTRRVCAIPIARVPFSPEFLRRPNIQSFSGQRDGENRGLGFTDPREGQKGKGHEITLRLLVAQSRRNALLSLLDGRPLLLLTKEVRH